MNIAAVHRLNGRNKMEAGFDRGTNCLNRAAAEVIALPADKIFGKGFANWGRRLRGDEVRVTDLSRQVRHHQFKKPDQPGDDKNAAQGTGIITACRFLSAGAGH